MNRWLFLLLLAGCKKDTTTLAISVSKPLVSQDVPEVEQVLKILSGHDDLGCPRADLLGFDPGPHLIHLAETVELPPWAPIRAATCVMQHDPIWGEGHWEHWVVKAEWKGLGRVVIAHLDDLPEPHALRLAEYAIAGPSREFAMTRLRESRYQSIRALVSSNTP